MSDIIFIALGAGTLVVLVVYVRASVCETVMVNQ